MMKIVSHDLVAEMDTQRVNIALDHLEQAKYAYVV